MASDTCAPMEGPWLVMELSKATIFVICYKCHVLCLYPPCFGENQLGSHAKEVCYLGDTIANGIRGACRQAWASSGDDACPRWSEFSSQAKKREEQNALRSLFAVLFLASIVYDVIYDIVSYIVLVYCTWYGLFYFSFVFSYTVSYAVPCIVSWGAPSVKIKQKGSCVFPKNNFPSFYTAEIPLLVLYVHQGHAMTPYRTRHSSSARHWTVSVRMHSLFVMVSRRCWGRGRAGIALLASRNEVTQQQFW